MTDKVIKGYRSLTGEEVNLINRIKEQGSCLESMCSDLADAGADSVILARAKSDLQVGIMLAVRSVAKPESF